ncbi:uncharacterized protein LOC126907238 [Daktulosphaira vitifoliae]|uniref:uncharacterized protein LOC126907238 n=1 Tax=Daktulosphaira vitifoliae TaxID=58002 RepID=UPI0021A9B5B6|nr:uncharacterized protein LOC126907238 [Daktulosphaira vitifoliae]
MTTSVLKHATANNEKTPLYNIKQQKFEIIYLDVNNLYGWSMSQHIPCGDFKWLDVDDETKILKTVEELPADSPIGMALEVTVSYLKELHDVHNKMPFLPERKCPPNSRVKKLLSTFDQKENYVIHYLNLKQAMANGLKVEKVHKVLQFKQSAWLSKYIQLNTEIREKAKNDFEKYFFKLMNNAVFGKMMERVQFRT